MIPFQEEIDDIKNQIIEKFSPSEIILFGSCAKGIARKNSDIDLCIILEFENKRQMRMEIDESINTDKDVDLILYTKKEWDEYKNDTGTFANLISRTGVQLYG